MSIKSLYISTSGLAQLPDGVLAVDGTVSSSGNGRSWKNAFKTITEARDAINNGQGNETWVKQGIYKEYAVWDCASDLLTKPMVISTCKAHPPALTPEQILTDTGAKILTAILEMWALQIWDVMNIKDKK